MSWDPEIKTQLNIVAQYISFLVSYFLPFTEIIYSYKMLGCCTFMLVTPKLQNTFCMLPNFYVLNLKVKTSG